ncbi:MULTISPECIES: HAMP domain-containing sensor histidine kinase [unclassified Luteococcus]|uniref:HAMP domain-containing sensor histidine kinase n=1 Tax=unclassified Luteococcus TaxID=2639923 RepID=UPI00313C93B8
MAPLLLLWLVLAGLGLALARGTTAQPSAGDVAAANDLAATTASHWPTPHRADYPQPSPDFSVVDTSGRLVVWQGNPIRDDFQAVRERASSIAVEADGQRVATLYLPSRIAEDAAAQQRRTRRAGWLALGATGLAATGYLLWLDRRILAPFRRLRGFADRVAQGDLDAPLAVDRGQVFGRFTQSFDILRTELARSRAREAAQRQAHKRLVGQLSHDIRTPLSSIRATTELLQLHSDEPRLGLIRAKADQIDALLTDLSQASSDELEQMPVQLAAVASTELVRMVTEALPEGWPAPERITEAMLVADPQRLRQVVDNLVANAAKYGAPPLRLASRLTDGLLEMSLTDAGQGVPPDELPLLTQPHYRASNAAGKSGQGLGLFTASVLLQAMGGSLDLATGPDGFTAHLTLALAEGPQDPRRGAFRTI